MLGEEKDNNDNNIKLIQALFAETSFTGFSFDTNFTLIFNRMRSISFNGKMLPLEIKITILSEWWMGSKEDWDELTSKFDTSNAVEPDEPVQAFELAILRWSENSNVEEISLLKGNLTIAFRNGKAITILSDSIEDFAWIIEERKYTSIKSEWSIVCENDKIFVNGIAN